MRFWLEDEEDDDRRARLLNKGVEAMSDRRTLLIFLAVMGGLNFLLWASVVLLPSDVRSAFETVHAVNNKITMIVLGFVLGVGMWFTYSLLRLKYPNIEELNLGSDVFGSYSYHAHSQKRWLIWLFAAIGGVTNLFAMIIMTLLFTS